MNLKQKLHEYAVLERQIQEMMANQRIIAHEIEEYFGTSAGDAVTVTAIANLFYKLYEAFSKVESTE